MSEMCTSTRRPFFDTTQPLRRGSSSDIETGGFQLRLAEAGTMALGSRVSGKQDQHTCVDYAWIVLLSRMRPTAEVTKNNAVVGEQIRNLGPKAHATVPNEPQDDLITPHSRAKSEPEVYF